MTAPNHGRPRWTADPRLVGGVLIVLVAGALGVAASSCAQPASADGGPALAAPRPPVPASRPPARALHPPARRAALPRTPDPEPDLDLAEPGGVAAAFTTREEIVEAFGGALDCGRGDGGDGDLGPAGETPGPAEDPPAGGGHPLLAQLALLCRLADDGLADRGASRARLQALVDDFPASPFTERARAFLALMDEIDRLRGEVRAQRRRVHKLASDLEAIKRIDLDHPTWR